MDAAFGRSYDRLLAWCRRHLTPGLGEPEEFVHQAYLRSRRCWQSGERSAGREEAYFFKSLRWVVADALRRQARQRAGLATYRPTQAVAGAGPVGELIAREALEVALTPGEWDVCTGFLRGRTERELCEELGLTPAALAVRLCRARQKLRRALGLEPGEEGQ